MQVDYYTTESVVSVDWENGFVEASAKENENVNQVNVFEKNLHFVPLFVTLLK